jgi:hypothetical protein
MEKDREAGRVAASLECDWGFTDDSPRNGLITSLSARNCFIKTKAIASEGQHVFVKCWLPSERWLALHGTVKSCIQRVGFSVNFDDLTDEQRRMLELLMDYYRSDEE